MGQSDWDRWINSCPKDVPSIEEIRKITAKIPYSMAKDSMGDNKDKEIAPKHYGKFTRKERRAITPQGFAQAFYEANR